MAHFLKKEREIKSLKPKESLIKVKNECRGIFFEKSSILKFWFNPELAAVGKKAKKTSLTK